MAPLGSRIVTGLKWGENINRTVSQQNEFIEQQKQRWLADFGPMSDFPCSQPQLKHLER
jgi:hypothetical protein